MTDCCYAITKTRIRDKILHKRNPLKPFVKSQNTTEDDGAQSFITAEMTNWCYSIQTGNVLWQRILNVTRQHSCFSNAINLLIVPCASYSFNFYDFVAIIAIHRESSVKRTCNEIDSGTAATTSILCRVHLTVCAKMSKIEFFHSYFEEPHRQVVFILQI